MNNGQYYTTEEDSYQQIYFKKDNLLSPNAHFHDSVEFIFVLEGEVIAHCDGKIQKVSKGDIVMCESYETHFYETKKDKVLAYVLVLSRDYLKLFRECYSGLTFETFMLDKEKNESIFKFMDLWFEYRNNSFIFNSGMTSVLYSRLSEIYPLISRHDYNGDIVIKEMLHYIHLHFTEDITLKKMSHELGYSVEYCSKKISKATKCNFRTYINILRLRKVNELLADKSFGFTAQEAMEKAGFNSPATYYRVKSELKID